jgi:hypothetical protein
MYITKQFFSMLKIILTALFVVYLKKTVLSGY